MIKKALIVASVGLAAVFLAVISVLFAFRVTLEGTIAPQLAQISGIQKNIEAKLKQTGTGDIQEIVKRLDALEREVKLLKERPAAPGVPQEPEEDLSKVYEIPVGDSAILGRKDAPVTVVVFVDYQCPFCARFHSPVMDAVKANPDKVKFILKHYPLPFHPNARPAAKAALAAGAQGKFYEMTELLLKSGADLTEAKFKEIAGQIGLNVDQFMKDYKDRDAEWEAKIKADMELAEKINVRGTPSYYLNGRVTMARSPDQWKQAIEEALKGDQAK